MWYCSVEPRCAANMQCRKAHAAGQYTAIPKPLTYLLIEPVCPHNPHTPIPTCPPLSLLPTLPSLTHSLALTHSLTHPHYTYTHTLTHTHTPRHVLHSHSLTHSPIHTHTTQQHDRSRFAASFKKQFASQEAESLRQRTAAPSSSSINSGQRPQLCDCLVS